MNMPSIILLYQRPYNYINVMHCVYIRNLVLNSEHMIGTWGEDLNNIMFCMNKVCFVQGMGSPVGPKINVNVC